MADQWTWKIVMSWIQLIQWNMDSKRQNKITKKSLSLKWSKQTYENHSRWNDRNRHMNRLNWTLCKRSRRLVVTGVRSQSQSTTRIGNLHSLSIKEGCSLPFPSSFFKSDSKWHALLTPIKSIKYFGQFYVVLRVKIAEWITPLDSSHRSDRNGHVDDPNRTPERELWLMEGEVLQSIDWSAGSYKLSNNESVNEEGL